MSPDKEREGMPPSPPPASARSAHGGQTQRPGARDLLGSLDEPVTSAPRERLVAFRRRRRTLVAAVSSVLVTLLVVVAVATGWAARLLVASLVVAAVAAGLAWRRRQARDRAAVQELTRRRERAAGRGHATAGGQSALRTQAGVTEAVPTETTNADPTVDQARPAAAEPGPEPGPEPTTLVLELRRIATRGQLSKRAALTAAAAVCRDVDNPGARALCEGAELARLDLPAVTALRLLPDGASAVIKDTEVAVGWPTLFGSVDESLLDELGTESGRTVLVGWDGEAQAAFLLVPAS